MAGTDGGSAGAGGAAGAGGVVGTDGGTGGIAGAGGAGGTAGSGDDSGVDGGNDGGFGPDGGSDAGDGPQADGGGMLASFPCAIPDPQAASLASTYGPISAAGVYVTGSSGPLHPCWWPFEPQFPAWVDGLVVQRWIALPPNTSLDTSNFDEWSMPVGARLLQTLSSPASGKRVETRLTERLGLNVYRFGSFVWNASDTAATYSEAGANVSVSMSASPSDTLAHHVPSSAECVTCHQGEPGRMLGVSGVQLPQDAPDGGLLSLTSLADAGLLSAVPPQWPTLPGGVDARAGLGFLHGNCGHCHNTTPAAYANFLGMRLRLQPSALMTVASTPTYLTTVGAPVMTPHGFYPTNTRRITAAAPATSAVLIRASNRGGLAQMPPAPFSSRFNDAGVTALRSWISSLP